MLKFPQFLKGRAKVQFKQWRGSPACSGMVIERDVRTGGERKEHWAWSQHTQGQIPAESLSEPLKTTQFSPL